MYPMSYSNFSAALAMIIDWNSLTIKMIPCLKCHYNSSLVFIWLPWSANWQNFFQDEGKNGISFLFKVLLKMNQNLSFQLSINFWWRCLIWPICGNRSFISLIDRASSLNERDLHCPLIVKMIHDACS